jgi:predicted transcriptional regulator
MDRSHILLSPAEIEARANAAGLTPHALCNAAGVSGSIFYRWRAGKFSPGTRAYTRLVRCLLEVEREHRSENPA